MSGKARRGGDDGWSRTDPPREPGRALQVVFRNRAREARQTTVTWDEKEQQWNVGVRYGPNWQIMRTIVLEAPILAWRYAPEIPEDLRSADASAAGAT